MTNVEENKVLTIREVQNIEQVSYRTLIRHLKKLSEGEALYQKYKTYKAGRQWRFERLVQAA